LRRGFATTTTTTAPAEALPLITQFTSLNSLLNSSAMEKLSTEAILSSWQTVYKKTSVYLISKVSLNTFYVYIFMQ